VKVLSNDRIKNKTDRKIMTVQLSDTEQNIEFELSSGNVFADIGFDNAEEMLLKSELVRQINKTIKGRELTSIQARKLLNIDEEVLANLSKGRLTELTLENLFRYLNILGRDLEVVLKPRSTSNTQGKLKVTVI
jgi:predicted XRE-type DNA-binding protein